MSRVTDVILTMSLIEELGDSDQCPAVEIINKWLSRRGKGELKRTDNFSGGYKAFQSAVFMGAFNYLDLPEFVAVVNSAPWEYREGLALFAKCEEECRLYDLTPNQGFTEEADGQIEDLRLTGSGEHVAVPVLDDYILASGDFTVEFFTRSPITPKTGDPVIDMLTTPITEAVPNDGKMHFVGVSRSSKRAVIYGDEYIDGVMFVFRKVYDTDGKMTEAHYTLADLVRG